MRASPDGGHVVGSLHGRREIFGYAPLPGAETSGAMVAVGIPRSIVLASVNHQSLVSLGFALAAIAVAFGTAWALGITVRYGPQSSSPTSPSASAKAISPRAPHSRRGRLRSFAVSATRSIRWPNAAAHQPDFKASEARYKLLAENTADLVTHIDSEGRRTYASPASKSILGYAPIELLGGSPLDLAHPQDRPQLAMMLEALQLGCEAPALQYRARRDGTYVWVEITGRGLGGGLGVMLSIRDISRRKSAEDRLEEANRNLLMLASTDGLTGLANRRSFDKTLARELARCAREGLSLALLLVDVDHFKSYNDSYGHQEGDECLKRLSHLLRGMARRPGDVAARYGGEEFAVILPNTSAEGGHQFAENLRTSVEALNIPHCRSSYGIVTVSIGLVCEIPAATPTAPCCNCRCRALLGQGNWAQSRRGLQRIDAGHCRAPLRRLSATPTSRFTRTCHRTRVSSRDARSARPRRRYPPASA